MTEALRKTFANRGHTFTVAQFEQILTIDADDAMQKKWRAFCRKYGLSLRQSTLEHMALVSLWFGILLSRRPRII